MAIFGRSVAVAALAAMALTGSVQAQTTQTTAQYPTGWNMVGGPPGTTFSAAAAFVTFGPAGYSLAPVTITNPCEGAWAYFFHPVTQPLPATGATIPQQCQLQQGWNLVGNPFFTAASLPAGTTAFYWDTNTASYLTVTAIPVGGSVWVYAPLAETLTLTTPGLIVISGPVAPGPYTAHVGDTVELLVPSALPSIATASNNNLQLQTAGLVGDISCIGEPACQINLANQFWKWSAVRAGTTFITITPQCRQAAQPCAQPLSQIEVDILP